MKDFQLNLGPYVLILQGKIVGTADSLNLDVAEATEEEIRALKQAKEFILRKDESVESSRV